MVRNGANNLYRRIASNCEVAIKQAEQDIRKSQGDVPYRIEHLYEAQDCAVTISTKA